jgi:hypothetical protein
VAVTVLQSEEAAEGADEKAGESRREPAYSEVG